MTEGDLNVPVLLGARVLLVPFSDRHLTIDYVGWLNDPVVTRFSENRRRCHTVESCRAYRDAMHQGGHPFWAIEVKDLSEASDAGSQHIGNLSATIDRPNLVADLAIMIGAPWARGRGFGREAWALAGDYLLGRGGMRKVSAGTMANNMAMLGVMRSTGMVEDGRRARHFLWQGQEVDLVMTARFSRRTKADDGEG